MIRFRHSLRFLPLLFAAAVCVLAVSSWADEARQAKSRHFAAAAIQAQADGRAAESHELYKKAYRLDPSNLAAGYALGLGELSIMQDDDTAALAHAIMLMRNYVDAYPADNDEGEYYAYISALLQDYPEAVRVLSRIHSIYLRRTDLLPTLAGHYLQASVPDSALACYQAYEKAEGYSQPITLRKTLVYLTKQDTLSALHEIGAGIRANPLAADGYLLKASALPYMGASDSVLPYLLKAEMLEPKAGAPKVALAQYYAEKGDSLASDEKIYEALLAEDLEMEEKLEILGQLAGQLLHEKKSTEKADRLFQTLRQQYPHEAEIQDFAAKYSYAKRDYHQAAEQIALAIDMDPANTDYRLQQLSYLLSAKEYDHAIKAFEALPDSMSADPTLLFLGTAAYTSADRLDDAISAAHHVIELTAPLAATTDTLTNAELNGLDLRGLHLLSDVYTIIGDTEYKKKNLPATFLAYDNALKANPLNAGTLNNYAYFLAENKGDLDKALDMAQRATSLEPGNPTYIDTYAWVLFRRKDYKEALSQQLHAVELMIGNGDEPSAEFYDHLGDIEFMMGEPGPALESWEKALTLDPSNPLLQRKVKHKTYFYE